MSHSLALSKVWSQLSSVVFEVLKAESSKEQFALKKMRRDHLKKLSESRAADADLEAAKRTQPNAIVKLLPVFGTRVKQRHQSNLETMEKRARALKRAVLKSHQLAEARKQKIKSYRDHAVWIQQTGAFIKMNTSFWDQEVVNALEGLLSRARVISRSKAFKKGDDMLRLIKEGRAPIDQWMDGVDARINNMGLSPQPAVAGVTPSKIKLGAKSGRIYLPVPAALSHNVREMGARFDPISHRDRPSVSPMYVDPSSDVDLIFGGLNKVMPSLYRKNKIAFSFEEMNKSMKGKNLHEIFDDQSWKYIRDTMRISTGMRCSICGGQGGKLLEDHDTGLRDNNRKNTVDCHEIWEWDVIDPARGIGVQKLSKLIIVCVDCHMMFHEEFAISKWASHGAKAAEIQEFLRERMALVNSVTTQQIDIQRRAEQETAQKRSGVENWLLDLSYLETQSHLQAQEPTLQSGNVGGITAEHIGGISFTDTDGNLVQKQDIADLYQRLVEDLDRGINSTFAV